MSRRTSLSLAALVALGLSAGAASAAPAAGPGGGSKHPHCGRISKIAVPGAEHQVTACLDDLTTTGLGRFGTRYTDIADWSGLHAPGTAPPAGPVPGIQIDGYFPDTSSVNTKHGWSHDAQFVIRLPDRWNGGLVVSGAPGTRTQYANDVLFSDWVLGQGYAFASTDKGNSGLNFYLDGARPGDAIAEGNERFYELTRAAKTVLKQRYTKRPAVTYAVGVSNGGYLVRHALENHPEEFTGGVDWEGTMYSQEFNALTYLPVALKNYPVYSSATASAPDRTAAHAAMIEAGFEPGSEYLWPYHYGLYWDLTQRTYRDEIDPDYDNGTTGDVVIFGVTYPGSAPGYPYCAVDGRTPCDADYDWRLRSRLSQVRAAMDKIALTGKIGKPLVTIHGTHDSLLPISEDSDAYAQMVADASRDALHRYYRFEWGSHVDGNLALFPAQVRPLLPCARASFSALESWTQDGVPPPPDATVPKPSGGDIVNTCSLTG